MSGLSQRQQTINGLKQIVSLRQQHAEIRSVLGIADESKDELDSLLQVTLLVSVTQCYHKPRICRKLHFYGCITDTNGLFTALAGDEGWLNSDEFQQKFRVTEAAFLHILAMVQDTPTFSNCVNGVLVPKRGPKMKHVVTNYRSVNWWSGGCFFTSDDWCRFLHKKFYHAWELLLNEFLTSTLFNQFFILGGCPCNVRGSGSILFCFVDTCEALHFISL
jgi:hypothetical protein